MRQQIHGTRARRFAHMEAAEVLRVGLLRSDPVVQASGLDPVDYQAHHDRAKIYEEPQRPRRTA